MVLKLMKRAINQGRLDQGDYLYARLHARNSKIGSETS
jgi:hypothetical protein